MVCLAKMAICQIFQTRSCPRAMAQKFYSPRPNPFASPIVLHEFDSYCRQASFYSFQEKLNNVDA